jgi:hypothetical protein
MSIPTRHIETDALGALRKELVTAAGRRLARRRARKRALAAAAAALTLLAIAAGAGALSNFSTGVSAIDKLLDVEQGYGGPGGLPAGRGTEPVDVRIGDGVYQFVAYLNRRGEVVTAYAEPHRGGVRGGGSGGGPRAADLARTLERRGAVLHGSAHGPEQRVWWGYADGAVESVRVGAPAGDWSVKMSPPWRPPATGVRPLRLLVVIDEKNTDVGGDGVQMDEMDLLSVPPPRLEVRLTGGEVKQIAPR